MCFNFQRIMAKTTGERQRAFVDKHRNDPDYSKKQAESKQKWRKSRKTTRSQINKEKHAATKRQQKRRLKIKLENINSKAAESTNFLHWSASLLKMYIGWHQPKVDQKFLCL